MDKYAIITDGIVSNIVIWDGKGGVFTNYVKITPGTNVDIGWEYSNGVFTNPDEPLPPSNEELRKEALSFLSKQYQDDIMNLNISWLAAAVSDGVNETTKKDAVISQINDRKTKYATDRAAIIAQYPED
ncbi:MULTISPECIES: hypothetical protein [Citrobacter]|uniref:Tail fiber assembly protein n=1 Tax=Citrobacter braakii TaxID=57706 RepID=A0ABR6TTQ3_CITBR|nr:MULTISPECIES: hypothetical protein [Citrobacter]MBC2610767.1 hypothetical protein [Citrobacter braakii]MBC2634189.1 hypothetical protein [Citrobacter braakii]MBC2646908.1 hypothetical protein [Citrobacter braakii]MDM3436959.1 hypothetical protein [Citrobacter sp. Cb034]WFO45354.1 hypothetical protein MJ613_11160 [Citrobacter braakii]